MTISEHQDGMGGASAVELELRDASVDVLPTALQPALRSAKKVRQRKRAPDRQRQGHSPDDRRPAAPGLLGLRDRALITVGFAGGFRRSELVALDGADLAFVAEGLEVLVRRSKTDQEGEGMTKVIAYGSDPATCPVRSLQDWLELAGIGEGSVFRSV